MTGVKRREKQRGNAMVEAALLAPWIFFLFVGVLDFGFFSYAAISTQNVARAAALANAANGGPDNTGACTIALQEMSSMPNRASITSCVTGTCPSTTGAVSSTSPLAVTSCSITGPDGGAAVRVIVTYYSIPMIPIPGVFMGQYTITRTVDAPVLNLAPVTT